MSLFPAVSINDDENNKNDNFIWLTNKSFRQDAVSIANTPVPKQLPVVEKPKNVIVEVKQSNKSNVNTNFDIDLIKDKLLLQIPFIPRQNRPKYNSTNGQFTKFKKSKKTYRYFYMNKKENCDEEIKDDTNKQEENLSKTTEFYNKSLDENPNDVPMWLKYVQFQDRVFDFEKTFKKGSHMKGARVCAERKLAIIDKALEHNPNSDELFRERVLIAEHVFPPDEMFALMKTLVEKNHDNVILWQGYIEAKQCSMANCNIPTVLDLYKTCLSNFHQSRRRRFNDADLEAKILCILYQCGLFLRQSGLWEHLWMLLRLYLELNLDQTFDLHSKFNENELFELEEVILKSNLPSHELWLRIEKLREACHWLPVVGESEDPQRMVFPEDVSELIHPITCSGNKFRLIALIFNLLKVPLLPCRSSTMHELNLDYVPWSLDSLEMLLSLFYPYTSINLTLFTLLSDILIFTVGPQYLRTQPGQNEYLQFILTLMKNCANSLDGNEKNAVYVWWFAFQRLIIVLNQANIIKLSDSTKKHIKNDIKELLKINRDNVLFFNEYAKIEYEEGNQDRSFKILTTALQLKPNDCILIRSYVELMLRSSEKDNKQKAISLLLTATDCDQIQLALDKYKSITDEYLSKNINKLSVIDQFLPDFITNWIICHGWLLYLSTDNPFETGALIEQILTTIGDDLYRCECLMEFYVDVLYRYAIENTGSGVYALLNSVLNRAIKQFPNNLYFLTILTEIEKIAGFIGRPWWKLNELLTETNHCLPRLFLILLISQRISQIEKAQQDSIKLTGGPYLEDPSCKNRMLSLFTNLTGANSISKRCGLIWRLQLKFLYHRSTMDACRNAYYAACEECPWLKALYMDAAIYIPTELPQIQDLLIEKQLRIHLTPEELEILRN